MAFKLRGTGAHQDKKYLYRFGGEAPTRQWAYVTADTVAAVVTSGYIDFTANPTDQNHELAKDMLRAGDMIWIYQVGAISDARAPHLDIQHGGVADFGMALVLTNEGGVVQLSTDLLAATVTYTVS